MKKIYIVAISAIILSIALIFFLSPKILVKKVKETSEKREEEDHMELAIQQDFELTKDLRLNEVPRERLINAMSIKKQRIAARGLQPDVAVTGINWQERGPNNIGGRTRALLFDLNDAANGYKKVWAGSVGGGLWYSNDITAANPSWNKVDDLFENIAITAIAQNPLNPQEMYFGSGEGWYNSDAIRGLGIWKSTNGGATWSRLTSTISFKYINDLLVDKNGNLYAAIKQQFSSDPFGIQKSADGGVTWTNVLGTYSGVNLPGGDLELAANGDVYATLGASGRTGVIYRSDFTANGATTGDVSTWANISPSGTSAFRIELACAPSNANIVYALFQASTSGNCNSIQRYDASTNSWTAKTVPTIVDQGGNSNFTRGQAWYDLIAAVDPNNENSLYIGGIDALRSDDAGSTWTQMTSWSLYNAPAFTAAQNVHADQHAIAYLPGSSSIAIWGTDGGIFYTADANVAGSKPAFLEKNSGYNVTQYYSAAIHPTNPNYFLAGSQDNGTQIYTVAGINNTTEASDGDGGYCFIDQNNPNIQITS
ncbi:MAG: sialidase family protein, partial [Ginsengibacter sp.]